MWVAETEEPAAIHRLYQSSCIVRRFSARSEYFTWFAGAHIDTRDINFLRLSGLLSREACPPVNELPSSPRIDVSFLFAPPPRSTVFSRTSAAVPHKRAVAPSLADYCPGRAEKSPRLAT